MITHIRHRAVLAVGRLVRWVLQLRGSHGFALPGLVMERLDPTFLPRVLGRLPLGVVVVSGTNGKTTTTKMLTHVLRSQGLRVFTNNSGSNFTRGIVAQTLPVLNRHGYLDADIAVVELDEAHATHFVRLVPPRYSVLLNVLRDQLDRFAEIDYTATLLRTIASSTTSTVILNRDDSRIAALADCVPPGVNVEYFGVLPQLGKSVASEERMYAPGFDSAIELDQAALNPVDVVVHTVQDRHVQFSCAGQLQAPVGLAFDGLYNAQNAAAALCAGRQILGPDAVDSSALTLALEEVKPAFGRGEVLTINGHQVELVLVKNPAGFRLALNITSTTATLTMIAINDNYADGRDMSWLWDVDFSALEAVEIVTGVRAADMALRLTYDDIRPAWCEPDLGQALRLLLQRQQQTGQSARIFCTYTAMLGLRQRLLRQPHVTLARHLPLAAGTRSSSRESKVAA